MRAPLHQDPGKCWTEDRNPVFRHCVRGGGTGRGGKGGKGGGGGKGGEGEEGGKEGRGRGEGREGDHGTVMHFDSSPYSLRVG